MDVFASIFFAMMAFAAGALAQTVKIGVINTYFGPRAAAGEQMDRGLRPYVKLHE